MVKPVVAVTGATGFVGSNLIKYLTARSYEVIRVSRNGTTAGNQYIDYTGFSQDFIDRSNVQVIIHLAGKAHDLKGNTSEDEYIRVNTELTAKLYDTFLMSKAETFIFISSVKAAADIVESVLDENSNPAPITAYGRSKLLAEQYIQRSHLPNGKCFYIFRPCMVHGPGSKGNLSLLYKIVKRQVPWPLAAFDNQRSFLSIENLCFSIDRFISKQNIAPGIYNICDTGSISTNELIRLIADELGVKIFFLKIPPKLINVLAYLGALLKLPLNKDRLQKLTGSYVVSNEKLLNALNESLPVNLKHGIRESISSFKNP